MAFSDSTSCVVFAFYASELGNHTSQSISSETQHKQAGRLGSDSADLALAGTFTSVRFTLKDLPGEKSSSLSS